MTIQFRTVFTVNKHASPALVYERVAENRTEIKTSTSCLTLGNVSTKSSDPSGYLQLCTANPSNLKLANKMAAHLVEMTSSTWEGTLVIFVGMPKVKLKNIYLIF